MGSYFCYYFAYKYPEKIAGIGMLGAAAINWYEGMKVFFKSIV